MPEVKGQQYVLTSDRLGDHLLRVSAWDHLPIALFSPQGKMGKRANIKTLTCYLWSDHMRHEGLIQKKSPSTTAEAFNPMLNILIGVEII